MDPATHEPLHRRCQGDWRVRARLSVILVAFLAVTGTFAGPVYGARHSPRDLAFLLTFYFLTALLLCCAARLVLLGRDPPSAGAAARLRRARLALWAIFVALGVTVAWRVADATPLLALKLVVWAVAAAVLGVVFYLMFCRKGGSEFTGGAEDARAQADAGRRPGSAFPELTPEKV